MDVLLGKVKQQQSLLLDRRGGCFIIFCGCGVALALLPKCGYGVALFGRFCSVSVVDIQLGTSSLSCQQGWFLTCFKVYLFTPFSERQRRKSYSRGVPRLTTGQRMPNWGLEVE